MQAVIDALRLTATLKAVVCNVEMPPPVLLDRQLARLSGIPLNLIRYRKLTAEHGERIDAAMHALEDLAERLCFVRPPFDLSNVAATADAFGAGGPGGVILLDYIQRIRPPGFLAKDADKRGSVDACMDYLRQFADAGVAVMVVSAVGRSKDKHGRNSYGGEGLNLASFRESSELEFGADSAFILAPDNKGDGMTLKHLKDRYGECRDIALRFDRARQSFTVADLPSASAQADKADKGKLRAALASLWNRTPAAGAGEGDDDDE
jgi:replicative DNA helicase